MTPPFGFQSSVTDYHADSIYPHPSFLHAPINAFPQGTMLRPMFSIFYAFHLRYHPQDVVEPLDSRISYPIPLYPRIVSSPHAIPFHSTHTISYDSIRYTSLSYPILPYLLAQKQKQSALFALLFGSMVLLVSALFVCLLIDYRSPVFLLVRIPHHGPDSVAILENGTHMEHWNVSLDPDPLEDWIQYSCERCNCIARSQYVQIRTHALP